jgi:hypothetical protein
VSLSGHKVVRGHLRLAYTPPREVEAPPRVSLLLRAMFIRLRILVLNVVALVGAVVALVPLLVRRRPLGHRTQVPRPAARVIPLPQRRRASPQ